MEDIPLISIVTPVYNVENFLPQCLDSIIGQTFQNWELVLINDGSTDGSGLICDKYGKMDSRIRVVHKANSGQADSRNVGMEMARAEMIGFVDSDDWIDQDMYEILYNLLVENAADIAICSYYRDFIDESVAECDECGVEIYSQIEALDLILSDKKIRSFPWNKLFRRTVIKDEFPVSFFYEDYATVYKWFYNARKIVCSSVPKYHYRQRKGSTCNDSDPMKEFHFFIAELNRYKYLTSHNLLLEKQVMFAREVVKIGLKEARIIAKYAENRFSGMEYFRMIGEELGNFNFVGRDVLGLGLYFKKMKIQYFPVFYFYQVRFKNKLRFHKKNKLEKFF